MTTLIAYADHSVLDGNDFSPGVEVRYNGVSDPLQHSVAGANIAQTGTGRSGPSQ